jgi:hypothetical protein
VSTAKNLAALVPCLMEVDVTFFFFPMSREESSLSSSDILENYFSARAYVSLLARFGAG